MVMVPSGLLLVLCFAFAAESKSLISEECGEPQLKRMAQCAQRNEIVDLISFRCFEIGKRGPCSPGDLYVLNRDSDCWAPHCLENGGCGEDDLFYEGECWNFKSPRTPCESKGKGDKNMILVSDSFGNNTCQVVDLDVRGVFDVPSDESCSGVSCLPDVILGRTITEETNRGNIRTLKKKLCSLHCGRKKNPHKDPQFKCG